ncbi:DUF6585 family protein [Sandaracinus amylolyticus]|uniref:DUF6585 family protein n=1 Tax=Sandaracinus amylolyticus TaxID=927083 RepID=UPI002E319935|nr:DUF6585 family protein [Sandaracinus amylolyticus]UJR83309.1 Hypothetical protein I5071_53770 [Sandaracinus amylolyticus]
MRSRSGRAIRTCVSSPYRRPSPPERAAAPEIDLGARIGEHRAKRDPATIVGAVVLPVIATIAALRARVPMRAVPIALLVGCTLGLVLFAVLQMTRRRPHVAVHEGGIVITLRRIARAIAWSDVDRLVVGPETRPVLFGVGIISGPNVRLTTHDGASFELRSDELHDLEGLANLLERRCSDPLVDDARDALDAGETLDFGPLRVRREGVEVGGASAAWSEIEVVKHVDRIELMRDGRVWKTVRFEQLVHRRVALAMLARSTRVRDGVHIDLT